MKELSALKLLALLFFLAIIPMLSYTVFYEGFLKKDAYSATEDLLRSISNLTELNRIQAEEERLKQVEFLKEFTDSLKARLNEEGELTSVDAAFNLRLLKLEEDIKELKNNPLNVKLEAIEEAIDGSIERMLSVPRLQGELAEHKQQYMRSIVKLEARLEKVSDRMDTFYNIILTVGAGLLAAAIGVLGLDWVEKKKE